MSEKEINPFVLFFSFSFLIIAVDFLCVVDNVHGCCPLAPTQDTAQKVQLCTLHRASAVIEIKLIIS